jgi:hypothetical protein
MNSPRILALSTALSLALGLSGTTSGHEERPAALPDGSGSVSHYRLLFMSAWSSVSSTSRDRSSRSGGFE